VNRVLALAIVAVAACGSDVGVVPEAALPSRVRLLTDSQYANAVRDLFGDIAVPAIRSPGTQPHQFIHDDHVLSVDSALLVQYRIAAEVIAKQVGSRCSDRACVEEFATRAFRRPLEADEVASLGALFDRGGFALAVDAILQAPSFVYRTEVGPDLTPYELASELAFLFLDSIPDEPLWQAARDGSISDPAVVAREVDRLLELPRVRAHLTDVVLSWLELHAIETMYKHPDYQLSEAAKHSMFEQVRLFVNDILWERDGSLRELLTSKKSFVDAQLAEWYTGIEPTSWHMTPRTFDDRRAGILSHPGVLAMLSTPFQESIIYRGIYVNRKFLCTEELGRPPFTAIRDTHALTQMFSEAQQAYFRAEHVYCSTCHEQIDPPGFALHHYDALGRYRKTDGDVPIEDDVVITMDNHEVALRGAAELGRALADSEQVAHCVVGQLAHHALGRAVMDPATRIYLETRFEQSDRNIVELFRTIATAPIFRARKATR